MECLTLDEDACTDYCIDCSGHGEEFGGVGEFVGARDFFDEDVIFGDVAFGYSCLLFFGLFVCLLYYSIDWLVGCIINFVRSMHSNHTYIIY